MASTYFSHIFGYMLSVHAFISLSHILLVIAGLEIVLFHIYIYICELFFIYKCEYFLTIHVLLSLIIKFSLSIIIHFLFIISFQLESSL